MRVTALGEIAASIAHEINQTAAASSRTPTALPALAARTVSPSTSREALAAIVTTATGGGGTSAGFGLLSRSPSPRTVRLTGVIARCIPSSGPNWGDTG